MENLSFGQELIKKLGGPAFLKGLIKNPPVDEKDLVKKIRVFKHHERGFQCKIPANKTKSNALQVIKKETEGLYEVNFYVAVDTPENFSSILERSYDVTVDQIKACIQYHTGFSFE